MSTAKGLVSVEPNVAKPIVCACNSFLGELRAIVLMCERIGDVKGMGTLKSGQDLAAKFSKKAVGGEDSLEKSLNSHIQVVTEMRDFFQQCVDRYGEVDGSNASTLASAETPR